MNNTYIKNLVVIKNNLYRTIYLNCTWTCPWQQIILGNKICEITLTQCQPRLRLRTCNYQHPLRLHDWLSALGCWKTARFFHLWSIRTGGI